MAVFLTGCCTVSTLGKLENGAGAEASKMWDRWAEADGDIAVATTWEHKVKAGVTVQDIEQVFNQVSTERNMKSVGELPLSKELESRTGRKQKFLKEEAWKVRETICQMMDRASKGEF